MWSTSWVNQVIMVLVLEKVSLRLLYFCLFFLILLLSTGWFGSTVQPLHARRKMHHHHRSFLLILLFPFWLNIVVWLGLFWSSKCLEGPAFLPINIWKISYHYCIEAYDELEAVMNICLRNTGAHLEVVQWARSLWWAYLDKGAYASITKASCIKLDETYVNHFVAGCSLRCILQMNVRF